MDTAYVLRDETGAKRIFPIIEKIWTQGVFVLDPFQVSGLGPQATGLAGSTSISIGPNNAVGFLWRVRNVVFEVFYLWKKPPPEPEQMKFRAAFRVHADDVNRRAKSHA